METESLIDFARDILQANRRLARSDVRRSHKDHVYLYTVRVLGKPRSTPAIEKQIETFSLWQAAHLLGVGLNDIVYLHKEVLK